MNAHAGYQASDLQSERHVFTERRILIVDDQESIRLFLTDRTEALGFLTSTALNGMEGLTQLKQQSFCGVLLDLEMPVMNGVTMLHQLRQESTTIPVIIMSADPTRSNMIKAIEAGAQDYLTKPIDQEILKYKCLRLFA